MSREDETEKVLQVSHFGVPCQYLLLTNVSLPCEHMLCDDCLPKMSKGADETVRCPTCRKVCPRGVIELITYTEQDRWDALLKVAEAWGAGDRRREAGTSEEEAEENFVDDETKR